VSSRAAFRARASPRIACIPVSSLRGFGDQSDGPIAHLLWLAKFFAISPARSAETIVYPAYSPDVRTTTGQYFYKPTTPSAAARDDRSALLLWQRSAVLAGLKENCSPPL
jgi:hypothetical protein